MTMTDKQQKAAAAKFARDWAGKGYEKGESQKFWISLLQLVLGVKAEDIASFIEFEDQVHLDHTSFIDGFIPSTKVLIEQKSLGKDLAKPLQQSDGSSLTPFQQAKRYITELPLSRHPRWVVVCNFSTFHIYDMEEPQGKPHEILLKNLEKDFHRLKFLVDSETSCGNKELEISLAAGEIIGELYDAFLAQYGAAPSPADLANLNILCVRLVFCLYAEDAGVFPKNALHDYLARFSERDMRTALRDFFQTLNEHPEERDRFLDPDLAALPYVNGGLFADANIPIPPFTPAARALLLKRASEDFDWSQISPTIFGAVFESTLNPETRRKGGMHYTSVENIHKVIDPLFLRQLKEELAEIVGNGKWIMENGKWRMKENENHNSQFSILNSQLDKRTRARLLAFQSRLASLTFFDPACGSGNFLTETYLSLRRLENEILRLLLNGQTELDLGDLVKVSIHQFYGIEINDFAVAVAKAALWIAESQMLAETEEILHRSLDFLPLKTYSNIAHANALTLDWESVVPKARLNYIMGNPPFVGYSLQSKEQKEEVLSVYRDERGRPYKTAGKIDYVACWYFKACQLMRGTSAASAFVSTNSITQGEQVAAVWKPLMDRFGLEINFAYRTFRWDSEAAIKAHVHCVIIGFSCGNGSEASSSRNLETSTEASKPRDLEDSKPSKTKTIFDESGKPHEAKNINPYLIDGENLFVESRTQPIANIPILLSGNRPSDGGHLLLEPAEMSELVKKEPSAKRFIKRFMMGYEFINNIERYCLWLTDATPNELRSMPMVINRISLCKKERESSSDEGRRKLAMTPHLFREQLNPMNFIAIPKVSSERRRYIPMGYLHGDTIAGDKLFIIPDATLYHFGILTSSVHMAWMRAICGRLKSDYSYSINVVYNNFPWPMTAAKPPIIENGELRMENGKCEEKLIMENGKWKMKEKEIHNSQFSILNSQLISQTAQAILDARALYPDSSLADLYDELTMPPELRKAHEANDRAVFAAYGFAPSTSEPAIVAALMRRYQALTSDGGK